MTCPLRTIELKSANSSCTTPETCVPTSTVSTASSVPVAPTVSTMSPRVSCCVVTVRFRLVAAHRVDDGADADRHQHENDENQFFHDYVDPYPPCITTLALRVLLLLARTPFQPSSKSV